MFWFWFQFSVGVCELSCTDVKSLFSSFDKLLKIEEDHDGDGGDDDVGVGQVLHDIDSCCRKLFPSVFVILNLIYWTSYVYIL